MNASSKLIKAYIEETRALIDEMDVLLKKRNSIGTLDGNSIHTLFRIFHTIKAASSSIDDSQTAEVSCKIENIISYLRKHGADSLPTKNVLEVMFNSEYFFRKRLDIMTKEFEVDENIEKFENVLNKMIHDISQDDSEHAFINSMVPFSNFKYALKNIVDTMSADLGKKVELQFEGDEIYVDRKILNRLSASLTQLVRNAIDHGIETPEERLVLGKSAKGVITVTYGLEEDIFFITVFNDGKTLNLKEILKKADKLHMLKKPRSEYKPYEVANLIMERGFSTKETPSKYSGRGVGMDVVKSAAHDMGGTVLVNSGVTEGFSITIAFPSDEKAQIAAIKKNTKPTYSAEH